MNDFILQKGERVLFSYSLNTIKNIYHNGKYFSNYYKELSIKTLTKNLIELHLFKHLFIKNLGSDKKDKHFNLFQNLFLFVPSTFSNEWEHNLSWQNLLLSPTTKNTYFELASKNEASQLYLNNSVCNPIWTSWYQTYPDEVLDIINFSISKLNILLTDSAKNCEDTILKNTSYLAYSLDLTPDEMKTLYLINQTNYESEIHDAILLEKDGLKTILQLISEALNFENLQLILDENNVFSRYDIIKVNNQSTKWKDVFVDKFNIFPLLEKKYTNIDSFNNQIIKEVKPNLPEKLVFSYISEYSLIDNLLSNNDNNITLVIQGETGVGKNTLLGYFCQKKSIPIYVKLNSNNKIVELIVKKKNGILLENVEKLPQLEEALCSRVFCVKEIFQYHKFIDLIVKMNEPNLSQRVFISQQFFNDENSAIKIAQRVKKVSEIYQIYKYCSKTNNFSWKNIQLLINNMINVKVKTILELEKWENTAEIVPVFGNEKMKTELKNLITYFNEPSKFLKMGTKVQKGLLLVGHSGTGKTHFVKNLAKSINVPVFKVESSLIAKDVSLVGRIFDFLRTVSPCVLFIDEIDILLSANKELAEMTILNSILTNIDGLENNDGILVIGATHNYNNLHEAATRSGRFDKTLTFTSPTPEERKDVWSMYLQTINYDKNISLDELVLLSNSFNCSDISQAVNKASIIAVNNDKDIVDINDLKVACENVYLGNDVYTPMTAETLLSTSYHEAGHVIAMFHSQKYLCDRVIVKPKSGSLGLASSHMRPGDLDERAVDLYKRIQISFGGLVAEELVYGSNTTGVSVDMSMAYSYAENILLRYSMHPKLFGSIDYKKSSEALKVFVENEIQKILQHEYDNTLQILNHNRDLLDEVAHLLFQQHEISGNQLFELSKKIKIIPLTNLYNKAAIKVETPPVSPTNTLKLINSH